MSARILKLEETEARSGLKSSAIYELVASGDFPAPRMLTPSGRATGWLEDDINAWVASRPIVPSKSGRIWSPPPSITDKSQATPPAPAPVPRGLSKNGKPIGRPSKAMLAARALTETTPQ